MCLSRTKPTSTNIIELTICIEKAKFGRLRVFFDSFSAGVSADGDCFGSVLPRYIHTNCKLKKNIKNLSQGMGLCIFKEVCWVLVLAPNVKLILTLLKP